MLSLIADTKRFLLENYPKDARIPTTAFLQERLKIALPKEQVAKPLATIVPKITPAKKEEVQEEIYVPEPQETVKTEPAAKAESPIWFSLLKKEAPHIRLHQERKESILLPTIPYLYFGGHPEGKEMIDKLTTALSSQFALAKRIDAIELERENKWESWLQIPGPRLLLLSQDDLIKTRFLRTFKNQAGTKLGSLPFMEIPHYEILMKSPEKKRQLWLILTEKIKQLL